MYELLLQTFPMNEAVAVENENFKILALNVKNNRHLTKSKVLQNRPILTLLFEDRVAA